MKYYVRLVQGQGLISRLIEFKESEWPSHVELLECYDDDRPLRVLSSRYPDGLDFRAPDAFPVQREAWYTAEVPDREPGTCARALEALSRFTGRKYNWLDILGIAANEDWHTDGRFICSEATAFGFELIGEPLFNAAQPVRRIWPRDFLLTPRLQLYKTVK
jgi:hypothetical protein